MVKRKRLHLFQLICFEVAFCLMFSALMLAGVMGMRHHRNADAAKKDADAAVKEASDADLVDTADAGEADKDTGGSEDAAKDEVSEQYVCVGSVTGISGDGALQTDISSTNLTMQGMDQDDLVSVLVGKREYILPVEIDEALPPFWGRTRFACDAGSNKMMIARSYQDFAMMEGYTDQVIGEAVSVKLLQSDAYQMKEMVRPKEVSVRAASNFRNVQTGKLGKGILYRGHSPICPEYDTIRCKNSDDFAWENQIKCVLNLNQNQGEVEKIVHKECPESYYRYLVDLGKVSAIELDGEHAFDPAFGVGVAAQLRFLLDHDGPYMVHCRMGKDRAGFVVALLEALEGSTYEEIGEEYAKSFRNYYGIREGSWMDRYNQTDGANCFLAMMKQGSTEKYLTDNGTLTRKAARAYLTEIGLADAEINALQTKLAQDVADDEAVAKRP